MTERNKENRVAEGFRSSVDIGMGVLYITISIYAMKTPFIIESYGKTMVYTIASLFILYGLFRVFRGIQYYIGRPSRSNRHHHN